MKKILAIVMTVAMVLSMACIVANAAEATKVTVDVPYAATGKTISVKVGIDAKETISSLQIKLTYDPAVLETIDKDKQSTYDADEETAFLAAALTKVYNNAADALVETENSYYFTIATTKANNLLGMGGTLDAVETYITVDFKVIGEIKAGAVTAAVTDSTGSGSDPITSTVEVKVGEKPFVADWTNLDKAIKDANAALAAKSENEYLKADLDAFKNGAIKTATDFRQTTPANQKAIDDATTALTDATAAFNPTKLGDKTALKAAVTQADKDLADVNTVDYDVNKNFTDALAAAKKVLNDTQALQAAVDKAAKDLADNALAPTLKVADKTALEAVIAEADKALEDGIEDADLKQAVEDALAAAKLVDANEEALQSEVNTATANLEAALKALTNTADFSVVLFMVLAVMSLACAAFVIIRRRHHA